MRVYVRSRLAWNPYYDTQDLIDEFIGHYYGAGAEGVSEYFSTVMENYERLYTVENNECLGIYYTLSRTNLAEVGEQPRQGRDLCLKTIRVTSKRRPTR